MVVVMVMEHSTIRVELSIRANGNMIKSMEE